MKLLADNSLKYVTQYFSKYFSISTYKDKDSFNDLKKNHDVLLCRSTLNVDATLLKASNIRFVLTASSGCDHINEIDLHQLGIKLFDAKGCNAQSVADYVLASLAYLISCKKISKPKLGIIGMGHVGRAVYQTLSPFCSQLVCFDPLTERQDKSINWGHLEDIQVCDVICLHPNLHQTTPYPSHQMINDDFLKKMRPDSIIINAARGPIVDEHALLTHKDGIVYCTDVYCHEPNISSEIINYATICTPHIAGHAYQAKENAIKIVSHKLHKHLNLATASDDINETISNHTYASYDENTWVSEVLSHYNPMKESQFLKNTYDLKHTFLKIRSKHHRSLFSEY